MRLGFLILFIMVVAAILAGWIAPFSPNDFELSRRFIPPGAIHYFGTDAYGGDVFSLLLYGARTSLLVSAVVVAISLVLGLILGTVAGYWGNTIDLFLMRLIDMFYAFPGFLLALAIVAFWGSSIGHLIFALCLTGWMGFARIVRGEILAIKDKEFVQAAVTIGAPPLRIIVVHLWPHLMSLLSVQVSFAFAGVVLSESALSFLGLGVPPNEPSWGSLLGLGRKYLFQAPWLSIAPGMAIMLLVLSFNLIGEDLSNRLSGRKS